MRNFKNLTNIVLIGFMGTGKTSVGRRLAQQLDMDFVDSDTELELLMGMSVAEIFAKYGEIRFRSEESLVIMKVARRSRTVISTGGGAVLNPDNLNELRKKGVLITLEATPETISVRTMRKETRPLLKKDNSPSAIRKILAERDFAYRQGDIKIDTSEITPERVVELIVQLLEERGYGDG